MLSLINYAAAVRFFWRLSIISRKLASECEGPVVKPLEGILGADEEGREVLRHIRRYLREPPLLLMDYANCTNRQIKHETLLNLARICTTIPIYDHFFDGASSSAEGISRLEEILSGRKLPAMRPVEVAMEQAYNSIKEHLSGTQLKLLQHYLSFLHNAQREEFGTRANPDRETLWSVTAQKGGYATLLAIVPLTNGVIPLAEEKAVYQLGTFMQLLDDLRDVREDAARGIRTLATEGIVSEEELRAEKYKTERAIMSLCVSYSKAHRFLVPFHLYFLTGLRKVRQYELERAGKSSTSATPGVTSIARDLSSFNPSSAY